MNGQTKPTLWSRTVSRIRREAPKVSLPKWRNPSDRAHRSPPPPPPPTPAKEPDFISVATQAAEAAKHAAVEARTAAKVAEAAAKSAVADFQYKAQEAKLAVERAEQVKRVAQQKATIAALSSRDAQRWAADAELEANIYTMPDIPKGSFDDIPGPSNVTSTKPPSSLEEIIEEPHEEPPRVHARSFHNIPSSDDEDEAYM